MSALTATFRFGDRQQHVCRFEGGYLGSERYYVNDKLMLKLWSMGMRGVRTFEAEGHRIEFRVAVSWRDARGDAYVDGERVATDLFADFNARIKSAREGKPPLATRLAYQIGLWVLLVLFFMWLLQYWD